MSENEAAALYRLMTWLSPSFPVGAFSYSSGIEWAVEAGDIVDAASLRDWLGRDARGRAGILRRRVSGARASGRCRRGDEVALRDIAELAAAFVPSRERQLETSAQGRAFIEIARAAWNCDGLDRMISHCGGAIVYPVAVGLVSAAHAIPLAPTCTASFMRWPRTGYPPARGWFRSGRPTASACWPCWSRSSSTTAQRALAATLDDLGSATFRADLASMRHETQYTRLFRS